MLNSQLVSPFAMLLNPERVVLAMEHSDRLNRLQRRVYRPLDKPLLPRVGAPAADFDRGIDESADEADAGDLS